MRIWVMGVSCLLVAFPAFSQPPGGEVLDGVTGEPVVGALIVPEPITTGSPEALTDENGRFEIELPARTWTVFVSAEGYFPLSARVPRTGSEWTIRLLPREIEEVVAVTASPLEVEEVSSTSVAPAEVLEVAGTVDNIFRALSTLPGVAATQDFGSRLAVRGGTPDQNLTLMDGIEVHNPYRLFGLVSAFNPETVQDFSLSAGGFGAQYGDRLSSLLVIENRPGARQFGATTSLSVTDGNVVLEGPLPGPAGSFLLTGRRTYYDLVVGRILDQDFPSFADVQFQGGWEFGPGHRLTLTGVRSREDTNFSFEEEDDEDTRVDFLSDTETDLGALRLDMLLGSRTIATTIFSAYRNGEFLDFDGSFRDDDRRAADGSGAITEVVFDRELSVTDYSLRQEFGFRLGDRNHLLEAGFEVHRIRSGIYQNISGDRNETVGNPTSIQGGSALPDLVDSDLSGYRAGAWLADTYRVNDNFTVEPGIRLDTSTVNGKSVLSPRLAAEWGIGRGFRLRAAGGLYTQSPGYEKLIQSDYFLDLTNAEELFHERATHLILGIDKLFRNGVRVRLEGYRKDYRDLLVGRLETEEERLGRVSRYRFPAALAGDIPEEARITVNPENGGEGDATGLDLYVERLDPSARVSGWFSYAYGRADRETYGRRYPFEYDRPHSANLVGQIRLTRRFSLGGTFRVASGFPYTPATGVRVAATEDGLGNLVPEIDEEGNYVYQADLGGVGNLHSGRLPYYARLDLRLTFRPGGNTGRWSFYAEVINALNRDNAIAMETTLERNPNGAVPTIQEEPDQGFPRVPTIGIRYRF